MKVAVAAVQLEAVWSDKPKNLQMAAMVMDQAVEAGASLLVLPELWNSGYDPTQFRDLPLQAEDLNGPSIEFLKDFARRRQVMIGGGSFVEAKHGKLYNTSVFISAKGEILAKYRKAHLFGEEKQYFTAGDAWTIIPQLQEMGGICFGMATCYDLRFPEFYRNMALRGCRMFSVPVARPTVRQAEYIILVRARAVENRSVVISANLFSDNGTQCGHSMVVSPYGELVAVCSEKNGYAIATVDTCELLDQHKRTAIQDRRKFLDEIDDNLL